MASISSTVTTTNTKGEHLNCDVDPNNPEEVCIGHFNKSNGVYQDGLYRIPVLFDIDIANQFIDDTSVVLTFHGSRPSHNNRLLNTQVTITDPKTATKQYSTILLIRKEAPCDIRIYTELWIDSVKRPWCLIGSGFFIVQHLHLQEKVQLYLNDVSGLIQADLNIRLEVHHGLKQRIALTHTCDEKESLSKQRKEFTSWQNETDYSVHLTGLYQILRPDDPTHWYLTVPVPNSHKTCLSTVVHSTRFIAVQSGLGKIDEYWKLLFDLSCMQVLYKPVHSAKEWIYDLSDYQKALVFNYMFALPWTGHIYVNDHIRGKGGLHLDSDIWNDIRTRPISVGDIKDSVSSFDCEDTVLSNHGTFFAFIKIGFTVDSLLETIQKSFIQQYSLFPWLGIAQIQIKDKNYMTHAFTVFDNSSGSEKYPIFIEGTALTSGVWCSDNDHKQREVNEIAIYNHGNQFFNMLDEMDNKVEWIDTIQFSTPIVIAKQEKMYKDPVTLVGTNELGSIEHRIFESISNMDDMMFMNPSSYKSVYLDQHPKQPLEGQPISWLDTRKENAFQSECSAFECACLPSEQHKYCLLYYTNPRFFNQHKEIILLALESFCGQAMAFDVQRYRFGRELDLYRLCICVC